MKHGTGVLPIVLVAALVAGACGGDGTTGDQVGTASSDGPPWGLDRIEMPDTEEDVAAVFASFPDAIAGRTRFGGGLSVIYETEEGLEIVWSIGAMPSEMLQNPGPGIETPAKWVTDFASRPGGATIEASAVDLAGDMVWVAFSGVFQDPPVEGTIYNLAWAKPDGSWAFSLQADSEAGRRQLVVAFVTAAEG